MAFELNDTRTLLGVINRAYPPNPILTEIFFPNAVTFASEYIDVDYKKGGRSMAPFVVPGSKGVVMARDGFVTHSYKAPLMRPKRLLTADDLRKRMPGESVVSSRTAEERAAEYRSEDIAELTNMCIRRENYIAAKLLIDGQYTIEGLADDGTTKKIDTISFDFTQKQTLAGGETWDNAAADAYGNLQDASRTIRRNAGLIPTVALCSEKTSALLLQNKSIYEKMLIPSRDTAALMSFVPRLQSPELSRFGRIDALNLDLYTYEGVYNDEAGELQQYIPDNYIIIGVPGRGRRMYGAVTQVEADFNFHTYEGRFVPKVTVDMNNDTCEVSISSRCLIVPESIDDWYVLKVK
ncbi:major capsid protein [Phascolarctobacterium succinatutens]|uniref:major capsid protein n=1 Tax=Phascolarctobacterium succinatutens TaxID=626940 RepID=UPI0023F41ABD|nr:major capsid protein [Phascolarctobacterium succinatutens]